jgi:hypothetical protein
MDPQYCGAEVGQCGREGWVPLLVELRKDKGYWCRRKRVELPGYRRRE